MTWLVIGIALALPTGPNVALDNVSQLSASWDSLQPRSRSSCRTASARTGRQLREEGSPARTWPRTLFVSRTRAEEFRALSGFCRCPGQPRTQPPPHLTWYRRWAFTPVGRRGGLSWRSIRPMSPRAVPRHMEWLQRQQPDGTQPLVLVGSQAWWVAADLGNTIRWRGEPADEIVTSSRWGSKCICPAPFLYRPLGGRGGSVLWPCWLQPRSGWLRQSPKRVPGCRAGRRAAEPDYTRRFTGPGGSWLVARHLAEIQPR